VIITAWPAKRPGIGTVPAVVAVVAVTGVLAVTGAVAVPVPAVSARVVAIGSA
jgi:hypothetical protein